MAAGRPDDFGACRRERARHDHSRPLSDEAQSLFSLSLAESNGDYVPAIITLCTAAPPLKFCAYTVAPFQQHRMGSERSYLIRQC